MKNRAIHIVACCVAGILAGSVAIAGLGGDEGTGTAAAPDSALTDLLSGVDFVPPKTAIDDLLGDGATDSLIALANSPEEDPGLRIRAYRALSNYPSLQTETALLNALDAHKAFGTGIDTLYVRVVMRSLAIVAGPAALDPISENLTHVSRDVRAEAALALALTGDADAIPLLRARLEGSQPEQIKQVRWAMEEAIRILNEGI